MTVPDTSALMLSETDGELWTNPGASGDEDLYQSPRRGITGWCLSKQARREHSVPSLILGYASHRDAITLASCLEAPLPESPPCPRTSLFFPLGILAG